MHQESIAPSHRQEQPMESKRKRSLQAVEEVKADAIPKSTKPWTKIDQACKQDP